MTREDAMLAAIVLSRNGYPAPNPHVGCVIVKHDHVLGAGFHDHAGAPHAERVALDQAGSMAEGADVYVTLEPCRHHGRTPPCAEALLEARVGRVFIACADPNPKASGGADLLRHAGIPVQMGLLEEKAAAVNFRFLFAIRERRVHVTAKAACSLDGRIALPSGESKWITGETARARAHRLRADCGAVLVGYRTVLADDPELTARVAGVFNQPLRIVIDPDNRLTGNEKVFNEKAETLHITGRPVDLLKVTQDLYGRGQIAMLVEGGGRTIGPFFKSRLVDQLELFVAPKVLGDGPTWVEGLNLSAIVDAPNFQLGELERLGDDIRFSATPIWSSQA